MDLRDISETLGTYSDFKHLHHYTASNKEYKIPTSREALTVPLSYSIHLHFSSEQFLMDGKKIILVICLLNLHLTY